MDSDIEIRVLPRPMRADARGRLPLPAARTRPPGSRRLVSPPTDSTSSAASAAIFSTTRFAMTSVPRVTASTTAGLPVDVLIANRGVHRH